MPIDSPRLHRCRCAAAAAEEGSQTFSPLTSLFAPELLYLESKWASLMSYGMTGANIRRTVANRAYPELKEMQTRPAHGHLDHAVTFPQRIALRNQDAPTDHRAQTKQADLELENRSRGRWQ